MTIFESEFEVAAPIERVWEFHADPSALPSVMTGPVRMRIERVDRPIKAGSLIQLVMCIGPIAIPWQLRVRDKIEGETFTDEQVPNHGPFKRWVHTHRFVATPSGNTRVIDRIDYSPPFGLFGALGNALFGRLVMQLMFVGRRKATKAILER